MSIEAVNLPSMAMLGGITLPHNLTTMASSMFSDLQQLLKADPQALQKDPAMRNLLNQLGNLHGQLRGLHRAPGKIPGSVGSSAERTKLLGNLHQVIESMQNRLKGLLQHSSPAVTEAATSKYGSDFAAEVDQIMNSNASLEDKLAMLGGLMADKLDGEIEKLMTELSKELKDTKDAKESSSKSSAKDIGLGILSAIIPGIGSLIASAVSGADGASKGEKRDTKKIEQLQTQIQLLMDKKKNFLQMVSNLMAAESRTQNAIISNIRG